MCYDIQQTKSFIYSLIPEVVSKDWIRTTGVAIAAIGLLIGIFTALCLYRIYPRELLGGTKGICLVIGVALSLLVIGGFIFYRRWSQSTVSPQQG